MEFRSVTFGEILNETGRISAHYAKVIIAAALGIAVLYTATDQFAEWSKDQGLVIFATMIGSIFVVILLQYLVIEQLLRDRRPPGANAQPRRYGSLFVAGLGSGLGIALATLLFVLPGLYVAGRWLTLSVHVVDRGRSAGEALDESWKASGQSVVACCAAALIAFLPILLSVAVALGYGTEFLSANSLVQQLVLNTLAGLTSVFGWVIAVAAYRKIMPGHDGFEQVFA